MRRFADFIAAPDIRTTTDGGCVVIESPRFQEFATGSDPINGVHKGAETWLNNIAAVCNIVYGDAVSLGVSGVSEIRSDNSQRATSDSNSFSITIQAADYPRELTEKMTNGETRCLHMAGLGRDGRVAELFEIVGSDPLDWARIYKVIEFFGGPAEIAKAGLCDGDEAAVKQRLRVLRQTANWYRHAESDKYRLPDDPPTLVQGTSLISRIMRTWLNGKLVEPA